MTSRATRVSGLAVLCALLACLVVVAPTLAADPKTKRISISSTEHEANGDSGAPSASADGRYVAFESNASDLVVGDTNGESDIFVRDHQQGRTWRISIDSAEGQANDSSYNPSISADGRFVAFHSYARDLVGNDTNGTADVFVRDRQEGTTTRVSVDMHEGQANGPSGAASISANGRYVAFSSKASDLDLIVGDTNHLRDVFVRDRIYGRTWRVSIDSGEGQANDESGSPSISADGRFVAFESWADDLVANDAGSMDVFIRDRYEGTTRLVSLNSAERPAGGYSSSAAISANGRYIAFTSYASDLVRDTNGEPDVFLRDHQQGRTWRMSVDSAEGQANDMSYSPSISADGRFVAFESWASDLVGNDTIGSLDVFIRDRVDGKTRRASRKSFEAAISPDGRYVAFVSGASDLVVEDTNGMPDVFIRGPLR